MSMLLIFFMNFTEELFAYMKEQPVVAKFFVLMAEAQRSEATPEHIREIAMRSKRDRAIPCLLLSGGRKKEQLKRALLWCYQMLFGVVCRGLQRDLLQIRI